MTEAPKGVQWAFQVKPAGASFEMVNSRQVGSGHALIGWNFGPDGALYAADWGISGYPLNQKGAVWRIDVKNPDPRRAETSEILELDSEMAEHAPLQRWLAHPDQRVRLKAQFQIVKLGAAHLFENALAGENQLARIHAVWGLGQLARSGKPAMAKSLIALLDDSDPEIQVQVARTLADMPTVQIPGKALLPLLESGDRRLQMHAAIAVASHPVSEALEPLVEVINTIKAEKPDEPFLVHAVSMGLAACAKPDQLAELYHHDFNLVHTTAVLALRRQKSPLAANFLNALHSNTMDEAARAIHDDESIPEALPLLADILKNPPIRGEAFIRRAINANLRLGKPENVANVLRYAMNTDSAKVLPEMRLHALETLAIWTKPPVLDRVEGRRRELGTRDPKQVAATIQEIGLAPLLSDPNPAIVEKALGLADGLKIELEPESLRTVLKNAKAPDSLRVAALENLKHHDDAIQFALDSESESLRIRAAQLLGEINREAAISYIAKRLGELDGAESSTLSEQQAGIATLAQLKAEAMVGAYALKLKNGQIPAALQLDVIEAAEALSIAVNFPRPETDALATWIECLEGGNAAKGKDLFMNHIAAQCIRCHKVADGEGSVIGPNLKNVGAQERRLLLESLVNPTAVIAEGYGMISATLKDGTTVSGQLIEETETHLKLRGAEGQKTQKVAKADIANQTPPVSLMPPMMAILSKREIRDVVAYLTTLKDK